MTPNMPRVAFATCEALPDLTADDRLLRDALERRAIAVTPAIWNAGVAWEDFDAVVIRSPWDYYLHARAFGEWVDTLEGRRVTVWNPASVLRWNAEKSYLRELAARGVDIVPTYWAEPGDATPLATVLDRHGWDDAVVKPAVSASAYETRRVTRATAAAMEPWFRAQAAAGRMLVQPFVREITTAGEWSLLFFDGAFSHATVKRPATGDFRVQPDHGGTHAPAEPAPDLIATAARIVALAPGACLYARVDGCVVGGRFLLMELEVLEPALFFAAAPGAADRLAAVIARRLGVA